MLAYDTFKIFTSSRSCLVFLLSFLYTRLHQQSEADSARAFMHLALSVTKRQHKDYGENLKLVCMIAHVGVTAL
jgi:hypothetical protein